MKLSEVQKLLNENGIPHTLTIEPSREAFYRKKGFRHMKDTGAFSLLTIQNPHHSKNIEVIFADDSGNPEFYDLEFGGYWFELFDCLYDMLPQELLDNIQSILCGRSWVVFATDAKTGAWFFDGLFRDTVEEEWNDMDSLHKIISKINKPKSLWRKIIDRTDCYEIFNWAEYERIIK